MNLMWTVLVMKALAISANLAVTVPSILTLMAVAVWNPLVVTVSYLELTTKYQ